MTSPVNPTGIVPPTSVSYQQNAFTEPDDCFVLGIAVMYELLDMQNNVAKAKYNNMRQRSEMSRASQEKANIMDSTIADVNSKKDPNKAKEICSPAVITFLEKENVKINGKTATQFFEDETGKKAPDCFAQPLDKGALMAIKAGLEMKASRDSDFVNEAQLQLQKTMQGYNVTTNLINSLQSMLADIMKTIAQNIR